mmetsp:Transcript_21884/g.33960  ORF Transcript_21884/g.33960 Transcript_21884/m.33960 type:complete len:107 (+) Transcript_21884:2-322(+)
MDSLSSPSKNQKGDNTSSLQESDLNDVSLGTPMRKDAGPKSVGYKSAAGQKKKKKSKKGGDSSSLKELEQQIENLSGSARGNSEQERRVQLKKSRTQIKNVGTSLK